MISFLKFLGVGGLSTLIQYCFLIGFVELKLLNETIASGISYLCGGTFNYLANKKFTFASTSNHATVLPKFLITLAIGFTINIAIFHFLNALINHYIAAQVIATIVTTLINFAIHKFWIYRNKA